MGTRGLYGFRKNNKDKVTYNHWDSYPEWLGNNVLRFINGHTIEELENICENLILVNENDKPTDEQIEKCKKYADLTVSSRDYNDWYCLLRGSQGDLEPWGEGLNYIIDNHDFIKDSLFCEYAYIINLDTYELEFFKGFQHAPDYLGRYGVEKSDGYYPCKLVLKIDLEEIIAADDIESFIKEMEGCECETSEL